MTHDWYKFYPTQVEKEIDLSKAVSIAHALEQACKRHADKVALHCMNAELSFRQFDRLANQFASFLQNDLGLKKGDRMAIMIPNVMQFPIAFYAAQKIGVVCVNTNPLYTPREMRHQFKDSGAKALVIIDLFMDKLEKIIKETDIEKVVVTSVGDQLPAWKGLLVKTVMSFKGLIPKHNIEVIPFKDALGRGKSTTFTPADLSLDDIAVLQYTGGTTGVAKGAMLTQRNILANMFQIQNCAKGQILEGEEIVLTALPLYHIFALTVNFLTFLAMGEKMVLVPKPIPIENTVKMFKKFNISVMTGVNTLFNALNNNKEFQELAPKSLKFALAGGMALQDSVNNDWQKITGGRIVEGFGLTESSPVTHVNPLDGTTRSNSIGIPLASTEAKIMSPEGKEVAIGESGELVIKGPQVMAGYWQRPEATAETIKDGWLWTGDIAKRDEDGFFYIVDRKKDMILVSGFNVFPNEVEEVLASHPKVMEAAVIGIPDKNSGEAVKAFIVAKDKSLTIAELKEYCNEELTGYKKPRHFEFRDELPKSNIGKILRRELRTEAEAKPTAKTAAG
mgnify:CR=1 FL=1